MDYKKQAVEKLESEHKAFKGGQMERVMKDFTCETLKSFCKQDSEFAQAVMQCDKTLSDCLAHMAKGGGRQGISDFDAFNKAVDFYFPGAKIRYHMTIQVNPHEMPGDECTASSGGVKSAIELTLDDLFD
jgi:hypothetical protein